MKFLGNSLHVANSGKLISRSTKTPSPGAIVYDSNFCSYQIGKSTFDYTMYGKEKIIVTLKGGYQAEEELRRNEA